MPSTTRVAAWLPQPVYEWWFALPDVADWDLVLSWLVQQALP